VKTQNKKFAVIIFIYLIFVSLGLCDSLQGVAWPSIHTEMKMPLDSAGILTTIMFCMSAVASVTIFRAIRKFGTGSVTFVCVITTGVALIGYSISRNFLWLAVSAIPLGLGQGGIDTSINAYVAEHYTARHMNWLHCFWGVGAAISPVIMTQAITNWGGWRKGYSAVFLLQLVTIIVLAVSLVLGFWKKEDASPLNEKDEKTTASENAGLFKKYEQFLTVLLFFIYTGAESSLGLWINSIMVEARHISISVSGYSTTAFYASIMAGRFISGIIVNRVGNMRMLRIGLVLGAAGSFMLIFSNNYAVIILGVSLVGLGLAPVYPCLMHITPTRFKKSVSDKLIGYQVGAAWIGGSILSAGMGVLLTRFSMGLLFPITFVLIIITFVVNEILHRNYKAIIDKV
jgi:fucose permease